MQKQQFPHISTLQNAIKLRTNIGVNGAVETTTVPVPKVCKYFPFCLSLQGHHLKSKSLPFLDEIEVTKMEVLLN